MWPGEPAFLDDTHRAVVTYGPSVGNRVAHPNLRVAAPDTLVFLGLLRFAGTTYSRRWRFGANTLWRRVRLRWGLGTTAESPAMKSSGQLKYKTGGAQDSAMLYIAEMLR